MANNKLAIIKNDLAEKAVENISGLLSDKQAETALLALGAISATHAISNNLLATTIYALQRIRDEKLYEAFGFSRFDDFLDDYEYSPMPYKKFNALENLVGREGEPVFNLLSDLNVPVYKRQRLGSGAIEIEGETVIITSDNGESTQIELKDRNRLLQTISTLADRAAETGALKKKLERGADDNKRLKQRIIELEENPSNSASLKRSPLVRAYLSFIGSLTELTSELSTATQAERDEFYSQRFGLIAVEYNRLQDTLAGDTDDSPESNQHPNQARRAA